MAGEYLIAAANGIQYKLDGTAEPSPIDLATAAHIGCGALTRLAADSEFAVGVTELSVRRQGGLPTFNTANPQYEVREQSRQRYDSITQSLEALENFLALERDLARTAGLSEPV